MKLQPSRHKFCFTPCNHAPCHFMQSHIRKVYACLAVTCHLHFWRNDRDLLRATAVTRGWNGYRNKSQHRKLTLEKPILPPLLQGFEHATFQSRVYGSALTTELSPPPGKGWKEGGDQQQFEGTQRRRCLSSWSISGQSKPEFLIGLGSYSSMRQLYLFAGLGEEMGVRHGHKLSLPVLWSVEK